MDSNDLKKSNTIKRLIIQSGRRGMKELDIILGKFAESGLKALNCEELKLYDRLLLEDEKNLFLWITEQKDPPLRYVSLLKKIYFA